MSLLYQAAEKVDRLDPIKETGVIVRIAGSILESAGPRANVGETCAVFDNAGQRIGYAEVIGFRDRTLILMPLQEIEGIGPGTVVTKAGGKSAVPVGEALIGRVINAMGEPLDTGPPIICTEARPLVNAPPHPLNRKPVNELLQTGVRAIDGFISIGRGQRVGIMAGSGVGKSVLLGMIARSAVADVNVIALIGERGREVLEFIDRDLGEGGLRKSVVVVVTSDEMPLLRRKGALLATTIAEYFRDRGKNVVLMMDSLTRVSMAQREIGLAVGEPPTTRGYPPSTFSLLPRLLERAGNSAAGSITGLYTVLIEGDDLNDPVGDAARSILDGHIVLARDLAAKGHYPAIDIMQSVSRVMPLVVSPEHICAARQLRELVAIYKEAEDLINIGAYKAGSSEMIDRAIRCIQKINAFLRQDRDERTAYRETLEVLQYLANEKDQPE